MIEESAIVKDTENEFAWVEALPRNACSACAPGKDCGVSALARLFPQRSTLLRVKNTLGAKVGEQVIVGIGERSLLAGSFALYFLPIVGMTGAALAGKVLGGYWGLATLDGITAMAGLLGFAASLYGVSSYSRRLSADPRYLPVILRRNMGSFSHDLPPADTPTHL
jgi:sigma-E factor negative regulatory protein RseC